jgi:RNA polymerase sigma-70 factor (sigma-E family)
MNAISHATGPPASSATDRRQRVEPAPGLHGHAGPAENSLETPVDVTVRETEFSVVRTGVSAEEQFRLFAVESTAALHRIAYLLCGDDHRAHDLTQIALERTYRHWSRVKDGNPFAYARRVLATARIDGWRRTRREVLQSPEDVVITQEASRAPAVDSGAEVAERERLVRALRRLGPSQRRVVVLRHLLDRSEADVAEELGVSVGNVKSQGARGLARLRKLLSEGQDA